ncbi:glycerol-3-phosphate acyltransferase [Hoyosella rhizosphaerae]|uniref:Glycerol-3-phosphate acyltransferase n=2 Tax=Hoyosella rhizosphaerae TaxID=1755582 RepID=A0A916U798_9ACTN|nr:glycerol-3-phosphate 1-O-acyltransferase [Hoyosella rhizosphaerae]GGC62104.1 glycerol-3-phosphate acyltransferase [Hoyosella rhizosphaerae]
MGPVVFLADARSKIERELITQWLDEGNADHFVSETGERPSRLLLDATRIAGALSGRQDNPLVVPVRVAWLPPEREGGRHVKWADVLTLNNPRSPNIIAQRKIVKESPERAQVLLGTPALLEDLRRRHRREVGDTSPDSLARYIHRSAIVTLERAERVVTGDRYKIPRLVVEQIMDSATFRARLKEISSANDIPYPEALQRARSCLKELVAVQSKLATDLFAQTMRPLHSSAWTVHADSAQLDSLRQLNRKHPLVFLPSHRSYADALVLNDFLARNDFPRNHIMGGANLKFWPLGPLAKRAGTVFIRRSFGDDEVYKASVEEYFAYLLAKRFNLEWYFEGGRSRTGKLRPPRYGLLNYVASALRSRRVPEIMVVPVSIAYERLHELDAIAHEQRGGKKQAEGLAWLAKYAKAQRLLAGNVYIRFGDPLSMRERLRAAGDPMHAPAPDDDVPALQRKAMQKLAFEIAVSINRVTPITANALVTLSLLGVRDRSLTVGEVMAAIDPVLHYIEQRGVPTGNISVLRSLSGLRAVLADLTTAGVVTTYDEGLEPVYSIEPGQHLVAAFYRNSGIHWFVNRAIVEIAILDAAEIGFTDPLRAEWKYANELRNLLKFEFFFPDRETFEAELVEEMLLIDPLWRERKPSIDELTEALENSGFIMAHRVLRSFFDAQFVVAQRIASKDATESIDKAQLVDECVRVGQQMVLQGQLHGPESISTELFNTALKLADNLGLTPESATDAEDLTRRRTDFSRILAAVVKRIRLAEALDPSNRKVLPGGYS